MHFTILKTIFDPSFLSKSCIQYLSRPIRNLKTIRMSHRIHHPWKQLAVALFSMIIFLGCRKPKSEEAPSLPPPQATVTSTFEALNYPHGTSYCGSVFTTDLKIKDGSTVGTVTISNDASYLYLTYNLSGNWFLNSVQSYAGQKSFAPLTVSGNLDYKEFPGKKLVNACNLVQSITFQIAFSDMNSDGQAQCPIHEQYFVAMRAGVKQITTGAQCGVGREQDAWAAPVFIDPGNADEWATAFYYCRQECSETVTPPIPPIAATPPPVTPPTSTNTPPTGTTTPPVTVAWCVYGQGYWYAKPNSVWCQSVQFGNLIIARDEAKALWPAKDNWVKKAFFQASSVQLSRYCFNEGKDLPEAIANDYATLVSFLETLTYTDIMNGTFPAGTNTAAVKTALGNIGTWICQNKCNATEDPTTCSE